MKVLIVDDDRFVRQGLKKLLPLVRYGAAKL